MARKRDRMFALFGAVLFLITSSALTVAVIYTLIEQHNANSPSAGSETAAINKLQSEKAANSATKTPATSTVTTSATNAVGSKMLDFTPLTSPLTKLQVSDTVVGTGATVQAGATVTADYVGALADNGTIFDSSSVHGGPQTFPLSQVIPGWTQGIPGMRVGGTRRLLIPASLGYGAQGTTGIPANSDLVFDVTITKID